MAKGKELGSARRGIAFSTASALVVSVLILIVGAGYHNWQPEEGEKGEQFSITQLGSFIKQFVGKLVNGPVGIKLENQTLAFGGNHSWSDFRSASQVWGSDTSQS